MGKRVSHSSPAACQTAWPMPLGSGPESHWGRSLVLAYSQRYLVLGHTTALISLKQVLETRQLPLPRLPLAVEPPVTSTAFLPISVTRQQEQHPIVRGAYRRVLSCSASPALGSVQAVKRGQRKFPGFILTRGGRGKDYCSCAAGTYHLFGYPGCRL